MPCCLIGLEDVTLLYGPKVGGWGIESGDEKDEVAAVMKSEEDEVENV